MTGCDFFTPVQLGDGEICEHYDSFSKHGLMLDPVTLLNCHGVGYDMGERQAPPPGRRSQALGHSCRHHIVRPSLR